AFSIFYPKCSDTTYYATKPSRQQRITSRNARKQFTPPLVLLRKTCALPKPDRLWKTFLPTASAPFRLRKTSVVTNLLGTGEWSSRLPLEQESGRRVGALGLPRWLLTSKWLGRTPLVAMVQASHLGEFNDLSHLRRLNGPRLRGLFAQS